VNSTALEILEAAGTWRKTSGVVFSRSGAAVFEHEARDVVTV